MSNIVDQRQEFAEKIMSLTAKEFAKVIGLLNEEIKAGCLPTSFVVPEMQRGEAAHEQ